jgi:hypothetical protein
MAGDIEKAKREMRWAKSAAEDRRWDQLEPRIQTIEAALEGVPESEAAPVLAELKPLREKLTNGVRAEKAGQIEREIKRNLSGAADQLNGGYRESVWLPKAIDRLASAEAREVLSPETVAKLQAEIALLQAKSGGAAAPPPAAKPAPAAAPQPPAAPQTTPAATRATAAPAPAAPVNEQARRIEDDLARTLRTAAEELPRNPSSCRSYLERVDSRLQSDDVRQHLSAEAIQRFRAQVAELHSKADAVERQEKVKRIESDLTRALQNAAEELSRSRSSSSDYLERANSRLDSDDARQYLSAEAIQRFKGQVAELQTKLEAGDRQEKVRRIEEYIERQLSNAQDNLGNDSKFAGDMLRRASEQLDADDAKQLLASESVKRFRAEIARVEGLISGGSRKKALDRALPILQELEQRVARPIFDGSEATYNVVRNLDVLKSRVRESLSGIAQDDVDVKAIESRLAEIDAKIAAATAKLALDQAHARFAALWEPERKAIAGWEEESGGPAESPAYQMPKTTLAVRNLTWFMNHEDIKKIGSEYKDDAEIQPILAEARKIRESALAKLHAAFNALLAFMEKQPRPSSRFDLEKPRALGGQASMDFEGTPHKEANRARANKLGERWEAEIEADRVRRQGKYNELSAQAAAAWPKILAKIKADDEFQPLNPEFKGRTVLVKELRNRIGWDFTGAYDFAIWVNETPVVGNYDKAVKEAVAEAHEKTGLSLDDHTDWDAVLLIGGPGKVSQRFNIVVRDRNNLEIGKIEEWRPVDCVLCTVIALRAGPVAAGPKA